MSKGLGKRCVWGLCGALAAALVAASPAMAEVTTDLSGTIVVYPKVIYDGTRDTVIQIANTSNLPVYAWCFYINGAPNNPNLPPGPTNAPRCQVTDFRIYLSRQQPTHWVASEGRHVDPMDGFGNDGSGLDPGAIPRVPMGFTGELKCVQIDTGGAPFPGNALKGDAVLVSSDGDVSKYNAVAILASGLVSDDQEIRLDNTPDTNNGEANSCYATTFLNHFSAGAEDPVVNEIDPAACENGDGTACPIQTELTMVPCQEDLENIIPGEVTVQFLITNEYENSLSFSTTVECWFNESLIDIGSTTGMGPFSAATLGSTVAFTSITPVGEDGGIISLAEEFHNNAGGATSGAAWDLQAEGQFQLGRFLPRTRYDATLSTGEPVVDVIRLPEGL